MTVSFYSHGKVILTGEYLVIYGADALALPLKLGQKLTVLPNTNPLIEWKTYEKGKLIFEATFSIPEVKVLFTTDNIKSAYLQTLLQAVNQLNNMIPASGTGFSITSELEFDMNWGLGSSSTLINNLAQWAKIDPFRLNRSISKGSGYDIACAKAPGPIVYNTINDVQTILPVSFKPPFIENLYLVYLNKKMATEQNIKLVIDPNRIDNQAITKINGLTNSILQTTDIDTFMELINEHDAFISKIISQECVKQKLFNDFKGAVKSLGAWGGDFILAASKDSRKNTIAYFNNNGYLTVIPLNEIML